MRKRKIEPVGHPMRVPAKWCGVPVNLYQITDNYIPTTTLYEYLSFLEVVYGTKPKITPLRSGDGFWLEFPITIPGEAGLRVASWLYGVPIERAVK